MNINSKKHDVILRLGEPKNIRVAALMMNALEILHFAALRSE